ncbi:MAG: hypothetical protein JWQ19_3636 [Subtercola sp.]|nr:hypothetical protein [Subtercola sp.]
MIPIPQPKRAPTSGGSLGQPGGPAAPLPAASFPPASFPPASLPRANGRPLVIAALVIGGFILLAAIGVIVAVIAFGLNPLLILLAGVVVVSGVISTLLRLFPQRLPGFGLLRSLLGFASLASVAAILYLFVYPAMQGGTATSWIPNWGMHAAAPARSAQSTVVYAVTGTAPSASINFAPGSDNGGAKADHSLPFTETATVDATANTFYSLGASTTNAPDGSTLTCTITVDGVVVSTETRSGSFALALCSGSAADATK